MTNTLVQTLRELAQADARRTDLMRRAGKALDEAADEIERLRAIENAALRLAGTFVKRNSTVAPLAMHKLDFALENHGAAHEPAERKQMTQDALADLRTFIESAKWWAEWP